MQTTIPLRSLSTTVLLSAILATTASAAVIGFDDFTTDGPVAGQTGGTGFDFDLINSVHTGTVSDWDNVGGTPSVTGGALVTSDSSAKREFNGPVEGAGGGDGPDTERAGAFRGVGVVFFSFQMTRSSGAVWSGASSYDFGSERIFFGVPGAGAATDTIGIEESGVGSTLGTISLVDGQFYNMVGVVDFDSDRVGLFVNPDGSDTWTPSGGTADVTRTYTGTNWSSAVRFGSGGETTWDNFRVATTFGEAIPEPTGALLSSIAALGLLVRRRRA